MDQLFKKRFVVGASIIIAAVFFVFLWEIYVPKSLFSKESIIYTAERGLGDEEIARELKNLGIIKNSLYFEFYAVISGRHSKLQAGKYDLSPSMSVAKIIAKFVSGDVAKNKITIIEGWSIKDISNYLANKKIYSEKDFLNALNYDFSGDFSFLKNVPSIAGRVGKNSVPKLILEGYIFPDTYYVPLEASPEEFLKMTLRNFDKKLSQDLRKEIFSKNKSVSEIITMASIIEKEVISYEDKKIVSGILWKRLKSGMPLQVDSTVNYITDKNDAKASIEDTKIDSPYNTYKYYGLPLGPISNPGMESILSAIYPQETNYWYYLSADGTGKTIFSATLGEHNIAKSKHFKY